MPLWLQLFAGGWTSVPEALTDDSRAYNKAPAPPTARPATVANYNNNVNTNLSRVNLQRNKKNLTVLCPRLQALVDVENLLS